MNVNEVAQFLGFRRDYVLQAITSGISDNLQSPIKLAALLIGTEYDITDKDLNDFISNLYKDEPKRQTPISIRRQLLVEARHRCVICFGTSSLEFHHILEYSTIKRHDPNHMVVLCATCHERCTKGEIDIKAVYEYKRKIQTLYPADGDSFPARFSWEDLRELIIEVRKIIKIGVPSTKSKEDWSIVDLEEKNKLNQLSIEYFDYMRENHQPYFDRIERFLRQPVNEKFTNMYYEIVDELNSKIMANRNKFIEFQDIIIKIADNANENINRRTLNIFLSFVYFKCDVGRKNA